MRGGTWQRPRLLDHNRHSYFEEKFFVGLVRWSKGQGGWLGIFAFTLHLAEMHAIARRMATLLLAVAACWAPSVMAWGFAGTCDASHTH
jgi:hypothetical protein